MTYSDRDRSIALAGIYQVALCVHQIATTGSLDTHGMEPCVFSLFQTNAPSVPEVFGAPGSLSAGMRALVGQLTGTQRRELELTRYVVALLKLERVLARQKAMVEVIGEGIEEARAKLEHFPILHPNLLANLADLYSRTLSTLQPRILVRGDPLYLQNPDNQNRIRTLLLAGIRAAWLWRQIGGSRWKILFGRHRLLAAANQYLRLSLP